MSRELKAKINDPEAIEGQLKQLGAEFKGESLHKYVYFRQPEGRVLKLTTADGQTHKTIIEARGDQFEIVANDSVEDPEAEKSELDQEFGIKRELSNNRRFFSLDGESVTINRIEGVGDFLIIESEAPSADLLDKLGIDRNAIVTDSFDNL